MHAAPTCCVVSGCVTHVCMYTCMCVYVMSMQQDMYACPYMHVCMCVCVCACDEHATRMSMPCTCVCCLHACVYVWCTCMHDPQPMGHPPSRRFPPVYVSVGARALQRVHVRAARTRGAHACMIYRSATHEAPPQQALPSRVAHAVCAWRTQTAQTAIQESQADRP